MIGSQQASRPAAQERTADVGAMIDGYRVERVISTRPGLHTLVEATARDGRRVTLKLLAKPLSSDRDFRRRLQRLTRLRASLAHPHLLPLLGVGQSGRRLYLASPATGGRTLADQLCEGPLPVAEAIRLLAEVAGALEAAGSEGLLHRDLAPENILLVGYAPPRALLTDFGIAVPPARGCDLFGAAEAVDYRSPEELRGEPLEPQSSVYSLACILVECLTGAPPYPYDRPLLTLHAHLVDDPPRISDRVPGLAPELDDVIAIALAKNPFERFHSPAALMHAAAAAASVEAPIPLPAPAPEPQAPPPPAAAAAPAPAPAAHDPGDDRDQRRQAATERRRVARAERRAAATEKRRRRATPKAEAAAGKGREPRGEAHRTGAQKRRARAETRAAPAQDRTRARRSAKTKARAPHAARRRRRSSATLLAAGVALIASAVGGYSLGTVGSDSAEAPATAGVTAQVRAERAERAQRAAYVRSVNGAIRQLGLRRAAARRRLRGAERAAGQAAQASALAAAYERAAGAVAEGAAGSPSGALRQRLRATARAYRDLAAAARRRNRRAWRTASETALERERAVARALGSLQQS